MGLVGRDWRNEHRNPDETPVDKLNDAITKAASEVDWVNDYNTEPPAFVGLYAYTTFDDFDELEVVSQDGLVMVNLEWIGEGKDGDWQRDDPDDYPHLRFNVYRKFVEGDKIPQWVVDGDAFGDGEWMQMIDSSYCTRLDARTGRNQLLDAATILLTQVEEEAREYHSIKKLCERLSWIKVNGDGTIDWTP